MSVDACAIAVGAVSGLGVGVDAYRSGPVGATAAVAIERDCELVAAGLHRPFAARAPLNWPPRYVAATPWVDRASELLTSALLDAIARLDEVRPGFRSERIAVAMGTSSGGMLGALRYFEAREQGALTQEIARSATYFAPLDEALALSGLSITGPRTQILAACAASTIAIGLGMRWLSRGACDVVLAGGYDTVSVFVAAGFEALRATSASRPKPFRMGRDGMALGEGAAVLALVRGDDTRKARVIARVAGFGASNDAVHITAPDRTGGGLARAGAAALLDAGIPAAGIDLVSAHGTATAFNDAMEAKAIATLFHGVASPVVHPFKAQVGHTLGAAGALEALSAAHALRYGVAPAAAGGDDGAPVDADAKVRLLERAEALDLRGALKLSSAFGGSNAALVLTPPEAARLRPPTLPRTVHLRGFARIDSVDLVELARETGVARDRLARLDTLCRLGLAAVAALARAVGRDLLAGAGVIAGHGLGTLDTNEGFDARRRTRGALAVEPRIFPYTSPNALPGECAIVYGLTGPSFAVGAGLDGGMEAVRAGSELVAARDADRIVVVVADDAGPSAHDLVRLSGWDNRPLARGAVALLLTADPADSLREVDVDVPVSHDGDGPIGHLSVLQWLG